MDFCNHIYKTLHAIRDLVFFSVKISSPDMTCSINTSELSPESYIYVKKPLSHLSKLKFKCLSGLFIFIDWN